MLRKSNAVQTVNYTNCELYHNYIYIIMANDVKYILSLSPVPFLLIRNWDKHIIFRE